MARQNADQNQNFPYTHAVPIAVQQKSDAAALARKRSIVFVLVVFALSSFLYWQILSRNAFQSLVLPLMWCPAVATLVTSLVTRRSFREIGWRPAWKFLGLGYLFPLLYAVPAYVLVWVTGLGGFPNPANYAQVRTALHLSTHSPHLIVLSLLAAVAVPGVLVSFLGAAGEEIGWRGLLVPELTQWMGFRRAALVSGVIWGLWHVPLIVTGPYSQSGTPRWFQVGCFLLMVIFVAIAFAWLRMRSHSVWPTIMFHAAHNAFIQAFFDTMTADTGKTHYFTGEFGIAMVPFTFLLAVYCWRRNPSEDRLSISQ